MVIIHKHSWGIYSLGTRGTDREVAVLFVALAEQQHRFAGS